MPPHRGACPGRRQSGSPLGGSPLHLRSPRGALVAPGRDLAWPPVRPFQPTRSPMRSMKTALPLALAMGVAAVAPGVADAKAPAPAQAAGGDVVTLTYPSLVKTRVGRTKRALGRAVRKIENGQATEAATTFKVVRRQMAAAWRGAKYVIRTTPPPPVIDDAVHRRQARASGPAIAPTIAAPADVAFLVLTLQHKVAANVIQLIDGSHGTGLNALATTLNFTDDRRDQALQYILSVAPPPPPADDAHVHARAAGGAPVVDTFDVVMPNLVPQFQDETQAIEGLKSDATDLTTGGRRLLGDAETQIGGSMAFVNLHWPPVPVDD